MGHPIGWIRPGIIKTVREPLILPWGGEVKSYAGAAQALTLILCVRWAQTAENATDYSGRHDRAGVVYAATQWLALGPTGFARLNVLVVLAGIRVALLVLREKRRLTERAEAARAAAA